MCRSQSFDVISKRREKRAIDVAVIATLGLRRGTDDRYWAGWIDALMWDEDNQERVLRGEPMEDGESESSGQ